jgi:hypothetical protein
MGVVYNQRETNFENYGFPGLVFDFARAGNQRDGVSKRTDYIGIGRTTTGTYVNSVGIITTAAAFEPRFDYDLTTGRCNGLLVENSSTNIFNNSENFITSTAFWIDEGCTITANQAISPDGNNTGSLFVGDVGTTLTVRRTWSATVGQPYTFSIFLKAKEISSIRLSYFNPGSVGATQVTTDINLLTGVTSGNRSQYYGNGWYRVWSYIIPTGSNTGVRISSPSNTGNGINGFYVWGGQLEFSSSSNNFIPTSYIPTAGSSVTRAADNPIIVSPNFYNSSASSIILQYKPSAGIVTISQPLLSFDDNTTNNEVKVSVAGTSPTLTVVNAGVTTVSISTNPRVTIANQEYGVSLSAKDNQFTLTSEGVGIITTTTGSLPIGITTVRLGHDKVGNAFNGTISKLIYYPRELATPALKVFSDVSYQGTIVTDGLVLNLDAGNAKSYPGSGTIWYDRAETNNGTLVNGVGYNSGNGGSLSFDGVDDYVSGTLPLFSSGSSITLESVIKLNNTSGKKCIFNHGASGVSFSCGMVIDGSNLRFRNTSNDYSLSAPQTLSANIWYHLVLSSNGSQTTGYVNGVSNGTTSQIVTSNSNTNYSIGRRATNNASEFMSGNIAFVRFYLNRALSAAEVQQNFNATKSRYI